MRTRVLVCLAATAACASSPVSLFYGDLDPKSPPKFPMPMWVQRADFNSNGVLTNRVNLTSMLEGVGYFSVSSNGSTLLLATQTPSMEEDVQTYALDMTSAGAQGAPRLLFADSASQEALLAPCGGRCAAVSTFHGAFSPDDSLVFAFTLWDSNGEGVGSQALAIADAHGGGVRALTWTDAGPEGGLNVFDECPTVVAKDPSRIIFTRSVDEGMTTYLALADVATGNVTMLTQLPEVALSSGCPAALPDGETVIYMTCLQTDGSQCVEGAASRARAPRPRRRSPAPWWGRGAAARAAGGGKVAAGEDDVYSYAQVRLPAGIKPAQVVATTVFNVPLTDTPDTLNSYAITQCDVVKNAPYADPLSCEGSDKTHSFFMRLAVNASTGATIVNSTNTFLYCMTPRCSLTAVAL